MVVTWTLSFVPKLRIGMPMGSTHFTIMRQLLLVVAVSLQVSAYTDFVQRPRQSSLLYPMHSKRIRTPEKIITDCMTVWSEEGHVYYKSTSNDPTVCGIYLMAKPDQTVHVYFDYVDIPCNTGGLIAFVDGWELNGQLFPNENDHQVPTEDRFFEICGTKKPKQIFKASQNAALIQYRIPHRGNGFSFYVSFINNPTPCNILLTGLVDVYTLRNYGKQVNCSLTTLYPAQVKILSLGVGLGHGQKRNYELETGTIHKCENRGAPDFVQVGGGDGLGQLSVVDSICGTNSAPENAVETIMCDVTTVRLVSSGQFHNAVTVAVTPPEVEATPTLVCRQ
ncbi:corticotropin-releasing factor-binding protein [Daktulosphaira vitifoliae]|uniref:corticotropin-releasing factor-binding protein n=1 Tax=Daktulosphaira vitifoliae TaxID=58002 RepID=UPI0021A98D65|nr:corticotropin-releasing factor-binding protein [Daktulosphaira vitifoliae]